MPSVNGGPSVTISNNSPTGYAPAVPLTELPTVNVPIGARAFISDSIGFSGNFGSTAQGSGIYVQGVYWDGISWKSG